MLQMNVRIPKVSEKCSTCFCGWSFQQRDYDPYWTSRKNSLELIELSSINKVCFRFPPVVTLDQ